MNEEMLLQNSESGLMNSLTVETGGKLVLDSDLLYKTEFRQTKSEKTKEFSVFLPLSFRHRTRCEIFLL